ncbi:MAG: hypothetical protein AAB693_02695 [Patescibacteria group bacterium]
MEKLNTKVNTKTNTYDVIVIGGGASGMMAAGRAAELLTSTLGHPGELILGDFQ